MHQVCIFALWFVCLWNLGCGMLSYLHTFCPSQQCYTSKAVSAELSAATVCSCHRVILLRVCFWYACHHRWAPSCCGESCANVGVVDSVSGKCKPTHEGSRVRSSSWQQMGDRPGCAMAAADMIRYACHHTCYLLHTRHDSAALLARSRKHTKIGSFKYCSSQRRWIEDTSRTQIKV